MPVAQQKAQESVDAKTIAYQMMTEAQFQAQLVKYAKALGWLVYHTHNSQRSEPGFPDTVLVKGYRIIYAELKRENVKKARPEQTIWLDALRTAKKLNPGTDVFLWRPSDWPEIERVLGGRG